MLFYDKYVNLCKSVEKTPSAVAIEIGIGKSNVTYWKSGRSKPTDITIAKIADYFGIPVSDLKDDEEKEKEKSPATNGDEALSDKKLEMIEKIKGMSKEELDKKWNALSAIFDI